MREAGPRRAAGVLRENRSGRCQRRGKRGNPQPGPQRRLPALESAPASYPGKRLANLKDLAVDTPVNITYPDEDSPGVLLKLGSRVEGGAGPMAMSSPSAHCAPTRGIR